MKTIVCVKQVPETDSRIVPSADGSGIDNKGLKWTINPYDEFAVEEAIKWKSSHEGNSLTVISVGPKARVTESLRKVLALGADEAVLVDTDLNLDAFATSRILAAAIQQEGEIDMIFTGKMAIDNNQASVTQALAENLGLPHATVVSKLVCQADTLTLERETEGGSKEVIELSGPAVVGANKGLNTPRYAALPQIMKAKKKPLKELSLQDLGVESISNKVVFKDFQAPAEKPAVKMLEGEPADQAKQLVDLLRNEAKVL